MTCRFTHLLESEDGLIRVVQESAPEDGTDIEYTIAAPTLSPPDDEVTFELDDDAPSSLDNDEDDVTLEPSQAVHDLADLVPGTYTVTQMPVEGWAVTAIDCGEADVETDLENGHCAAQLPQPGPVDCTFTNTQLGSITIVDDAKGLKAAATDPQDFHFTTTGGLSPTTFVLDDDADGTLAANAEYTDLDPGPYTIRQDAVLGWSLTGLVCDTGEVVTLATRTVAIDVAGGEHVTCTFTNARRQPDAHGKRTTDIAHQGNDVYDTSVPGTPKRTINAKRGGIVKFFLRVTNDGGDTDSFKLKGTTNTTGGFTVSYTNSLTWYQRGQGGDAHVHRHADDVDGQGHHRSCCVHRPWQSDPRRRST